MNELPKTIICDIDGTLFEHCNEIDKQITLEPKVLSGAIETFQQWDRKGYRIILITGRRESTRNITEKQLANAGIFYDSLIMGVGGGNRILINDLKTTHDEPTAIAYNLKRNSGINSLKDI